MRGENPHEWSKLDWRKAWDYFVDFYGPGGLYYRHFGFDQLKPPINQIEFRTALLADYDAVETAGLDWWEWATVERERVRDRILIARGREPIEPEAFPENWNEETR